MKEQFERSCDVLPENIWLSLYIAEGGVIKKIACIVLGAVRVIMRKIGVNIIPLYCRIGGNKIRSAEYDAVISFHEGLSPIVCYYPAKHRIAWIHCDYSRQIEMTGKNEQKEYARFDKIVCVSEYARKVFSDIYPSLAPKTLAIHNVMDINGIIRKAALSDNLDARFDNSVYTILSMGRLDPVKQFSLIPQIASQIKSLTTVPFRWFILGGSRGFDEEELKLKNAIAQFDVEKEVFLLGEKNNVYPYLAKSNLYVCTSQSESFPLAINEAKVLGIPIVSNAFSSITESIEDGVDGFITEIDKMPQIIVQMMTQPMALKKGSIDNTNSLFGFYNLIEN
jgi:glycosyltransferase involved in cell wall biosynthesis